MISSSSGHQQDMVPRGVEAWVVGFDEVINLRADPPELADLFREHSAATFRIIYRVLGPGATRADVEDLTQQAFLAAHRALPKFRGEASITSWLFSIALRTTYREIRSRSRQRRMVAALEAIIDTSPQANDPHDRLVEQRQELARVWRCLLQISAKKRMVYVLHDLEQFLGSEIAELLDVKEPTVHSRLRHARAELMTLLDQEGR